jgi:hypothetical protein
LKADSSHNREETTSSASVRSLIITMAEMSKAHPVPLFKDSSMPKKKPKLHLILIEEDELQELLKFDPWMKTPPAMVALLQRVSNCSATQFNDGTWDMNVMMGKFGIGEPGSSHYQREHSTGTTALHVLSTLMNETGEDIYAPN